MKTNTANIGFLISLFIFPCVSVAGNWFDKENRSCDFVSPASVIKPLFQQKNTAAGGRYISIPKASLNVFLSTPNVSLSLNPAFSVTEVKLMKASIGALKDAPQAASIALSIVDNISDFSGVFSIAAGGLVEWLSSKAEVGEKSIDRLIDFVTVGGRTGHQIAFRSAKENFKPLIMINSFYEVQVGAEPKLRRWLFSACLLPIEIILSDIETKDPGPHANNKRIIQQPGGAWRLWDITDQKYDSKTLLYIEQDEVFAYFLDSQDNTTSYRIGFYGGPMQRRSSPSANWATLYNNVETK